METINFRIDKNQIFVTLAKGDYINKTFEYFAEIKGFGCAWINGIGAVENITLGSYSIEIKDYIKKEFKGEFELTSLVGNITIKNGNPFVHIHVNVSDEACNAYGGHLFSGTITATGELIIFLSNSVINRKESSDIGLYLWNLNEDN